jgi:hypothetical protein
MRSLRNAAAGARLIQAEGLDSKSAADVATSLADALEEFHRLQRRSRSTYPTGLRMPVKALPLSRPILIDVTGRKLAEAVEAILQELRESHGTGPDRTVLRLLPRLWCRDAVPACIRAARASSWSSRRPKGRPIVCPGKRGPNFSRVSAVHFG